MAEWNNAEEGLWPEDRRWIFIRWKQQPTLPQFKEFINQETCSGGHFIGRRELKGAFWMYVPDFPEMSKRDWMKYG